MPPLNSLPSRSGSGALMHHQQGHQRDNRKQQIANNNKIALKQRVDKNDKRGERPAANGSATVCK